MSLFLHYIICSPVDPLQWMGAIRMRVQTADKNTKYPQHDPNPSTNILWKTMFLRNKSSINFKPSCMAKTQVYNPQLSFLQWKSCCLASKNHWTVFACKQCLICVYFSLFHTRLLFPQEKAISWIEDYFSWKRLTGFVSFIHTAFCLTRC